MSTHAVRESAAGACVVLRAGANWELIVTSGGPGCQCALVWLHSLPLGMCIGGGYQAGGVQLHNWGG